MTASAFVAAAAILSVALLVFKPSPEPVPEPAHVTAVQAPPAAPPAFSPPAESPEAPAADDPLRPDSAPATPPSSASGSPPAAPEPPPVSGGDSRLPGGKPLLPGSLPPEQNPAPVKLSPRARSVPEKTPPVKVRQLVPAASLPHERRPERIPRHTGRLCFVIDDAGNNLRELEPFMHLPFKYTVAVLPGLPHSAEAARRLRASGAEVILHQPMEAIGGQNPGPGAIYSGMSPAQVRAILEKNIKEVGPVVGMNNHQGSKITKDAAIMEVVLAFCRDHGIYYLDSKTTADSVVPELARKMGIRIKERDVFIDNIQERSSMIRYVQDGVQKAEKKGAAVMIGHAWSTDLADTLHSLYPELVEQGFSLSTISQFMMGKWDDEGSGN